MIHVHCPEVFKTELVPMLSQQRPVEQPVKRHHFPIDAERICSRIIYFKKIILVSLVKLEPTKKTPLLIETFELFPRKFSDRRPCLQLHLFPGKLLAGILSFSKWIGKNPERKM